MSSEDLPVTESDGLDGTGGGILAVVYIDKSGGFAIVDVNFVNRSSIQEVTLNRNAGDRMLRSGVNRRNADLRDGKAYSFGEELL